MATAAAARAVSGTHLSSSIAGSRTLGSKQSEFAGVTTSFANLSLSKPAIAPLERYTGPVAKRVCDLTGKKANNKMIVTFSHKRIHKLQQPNLFMKRLWWEKKGKFVRMKLSASAIKSVDKHGLEEMAKKAGLDLNDYISA
eukprot:TRINITY_DN18103_c0_g1_i1.p1 TRINITY_DN18103_c0_g1~~TRINITY_DN18103_c0_g1_i1.p1  ORF type:complete len:141 (+),score=19.36 TRINITY_DN18103_c0_g1_i1:162-584(+)